MLLSVVKRIIHVRYAAIKRGVISSGPVSRPPHLYSLPSSTFFERLAQSALGSPSDGEVGFYSCKAPEGNFVTLMLTDTRYNIHNVLFAWNQIKMACPCPGR